jgi:NAD(P)-dependent dehydrogenase (short-subunit alcohol dehydrogenase family)
MSNRFEGKTVIVTGAGSGIGKATAIRIAQEGGRVIASDVVEERLDQLKSENPGLAITTVTGDITKDEVIKQIVDAAGAEIWGLANIAGIMDSFQPVHEIDWAQWNLVLAVNLTASAKLMAAVIPSMLAVGKGSIVNCSSEAGLRGSAAGAAYTTSKHAVIGLTKSSAVMYAKKGIRVNAIAPGAVATGIQADFKSQLGAEVLGAYMQTNVGTVATAEQLAASFCWLLSEDSSNVNGAIIANDGGWSAI